MDGRYAISVENSANLRHMQFSCSFLFCYRQPRTAPRTPFSGLAPPLFTFGVRKANLDDNWHVGPRPFQDL